MSGTEALSLGVVDSLVSDPSKTSFDSSDLERNEEDDLMREALKIASDFACSSPVAARGVLQTMRMQATNGLEESLRREADQQALDYARQDWVKQGIDSVINKRQPDFDEYFSS